MVADSAVAGPSVAARAEEARPPFAERTALGDAVEACGVGPLLQLPSGFGSVFLGEQFHAFISASNLGPASIASVSIKVGLCNPRTASISALSLCTAHAVIPRPRLQIKPDSSCGRHLNCRIDQTLAHLIGRYRY